MATEFSLDAVLQFLGERGGRARSDELLEHFNMFLSNPDSRAKDRGVFKEFVNRVGVVVHEGGVKYVSLKKKYRDKLKPGADSNSPAAAAAAGEAEVGQPRPAAAASGSPVGRGDQVAGGAVTDPVGSLPPVPAVDRGGLDESGDDARCALTPPPSLPPAAAGCNPTGSIDQRGGPIPQQRVCANGAFLPAVEGTSDAERSPPTWSNDGHNASTTSSLGRGGDGAKDQEVPECPQTHADVGERFPHPDFKGIEWVKQSSIPADTFDLSTRDNQARNPVIWDLSENNSAHTARSSLQEDVSSAGQDVRSKNVSNSMLQSNVSPTQVKTNPDLNTRRPSRKLLQRSLTVNRDDRSSSLDIDGFEGTSDPACPHSESLPNTPRSSRKNFRELMINSSPQLRRSVIYNNPVVALPNIKLGDAGSRKSDSDTISLVSSKLDDDDTASVALDPLEHEWMIHASEGRWDSLETLLAADPSLITRKDFVTGFTCIHWAAKHGRPELLATLVNYAGKHDIQININLRSSGGYTPLHLAAMHGHTEVVKLLSGAYDANADVRDYSGKKAWQYLTRDVLEEVRSLIGVSRISDPESASQNGGGRWRLSKVLPANLTHKLVNVPEEETIAAMPSKAVSRKTSTKMKLNRIRFKTQIIHSTPSLRGTDNDRGPKSPLKLRPKSTIFG